MRDMDAPAMASDAPSNPPNVARDVPEVKMLDAASPSLGLDQDRESATPSPIHRHRQHPVGWSLQDEEHESEVETDDDGESTCEEDTSSDDQNDDDDNDNALTQLQHWLKAHCEDSLFACGGTIPIITDTGKTDSPKKEPSADEKTPSSPASASSRLSSSSAAPSAPPHPPVTLRWDPRDAMAPAAHCKLNFPIQESDADNLDRLLADMNPATFGRGGEHVYDESYRKASKLDPSSFTTNFCPYTSGIMDVVSQVLLPNPLSEKQRSIKAELYKLNVYTGPSGHFRSHVDTPRSRYQIGSLVVCLPAKHEGGVLEVRQLEQVMTFDWAPGAEPNAPQIQWAAFYSDCEHEVLPVQSGHRITLTYNLYVTRGGGHLSNRPSALDVTQTPLYGHLEALINDETFMPDGGYLGFYTTHAYAHTWSKACLTDTLKGVDMTVWQTFQRLRCGVCLRPVLTTDPFERTRLSSHVGREFPLAKYSWTIEQEDDWMPFLEHSWGLEKISAEDLVWLNKADNRTAQASFAYLTYGNEPSTHLAYSLCAIIIGVPKWSDNGRMTLKTTFSTFTTDEKNWDDHPPYPYDDSF